MRRRLLILAYYFPPLGLSGVQRVLKWAKYLPDSGWDVTVLTAHPGSYFAHDETLLADLEGREVTIIRTSSLDPTRWARSKKVGLPGGNRRQILNRISQTLFQPDNKIGWYPFAVARGKKLLSEHTFDAIYSSAPPYTSHLIGASLSRFSGVPLVIDYRDDWINNPRHNYPSRWHRRFSIRLEKTVFAVASGITTINEPIRSELLSRVNGQVPANRIRVFPHGFDPDDFDTASFDTASFDTASFDADAIAANVAAAAPDGSDSVVSPEILSQKPITFVYSGVFYDAQKPDTFLRALAGFLEQNDKARKTVRARFVGLIPENAHRIVAELGLTDVIVFDGYVNHRVAALAISDADILWMTVGDTDGSHMISTSKLYEYFGTGNPILGLVPDGTAKSALEEYGAAEIVHPDDVDGVTLAIGTMYNAQRTGSARRGNAQFIEQFNRKRLAAELGVFLEQICASEKVG